MTQTRWVLLELVVGDEKVKATGEEVGRNFDSVEEYIDWEIQWLVDSFDSVSILEICDELNHDVFEVEDE